MAMRGLKPVVEIQFFDYIWPAMMQLRNEMSMLRYRSGNHLVVPDGRPRPDRRLPARRRAVSQPVRREHLRALPGHPHRVSRRTPSTRPACCARRSAATIRCMFLEHKHLYRQTYNKGEYPGKELHGAVRQGGRPPRRRRRARRHLGRARPARAASPRTRPRSRACSVAVLDLRTIVPYDWEAIAAHVKRTNRVIVAHEDQLTCGFGAEIAARIAGELFEHLDAPVRRVGALDTPVAYCPDLEEAILPQTADILAAIQRNSRVLRRASRPALLRSVVCGWLVAASLFLPSLVALTPDVLRPVRRRAAACRRPVSGRPRVSAVAGWPVTYVFDRRAHPVFAIDEAVRERVADRPDRRRAWPHHRPDGVFDRAGRHGSSSRTRPSGTRADSGLHAGRVSRIGGFTLPGRSRARVASDDMVAQRDRVAPVHRLVDPRCRSRRTAHSSPSTRHRDARAGRSGPCARPATRTTGICTSR